MNSHSIESRIVNCHPDSGGNFIGDSGTGTISRRQASTALLAAVAAGGDAGLRRHWIHRPERVPVLRVGGARNGLRGAVDYAKLATAMKLPG